MRKNAKSGMLKRDTSQTLKRMLTSDFKNQRNNKFSGD